MGLLTNILSGILPQPLGQVANLYSSFKAGRSISQPVRQLPATQTQPAFGPQLFVGPRQIAQLQNQQPQTRTLSQQPQQPTSLGATQIQQPQQFQQAQQPQQGNAEDLTLSIIKAMLQANSDAGDKDLEERRNAIIQARFNSQRQATPEELRVLSPQAQAGLRGLDESGLSAQLGGVEAAITSRQNERKAKLETLFNVAKLIDSQKKAEGITPYQQKQLELDEKKLQLEYDKLNRKEDGGISEQYRVERAKRIVSDIDAVLPDVTDLNTGISGKTLLNIAGSGAYNLQQSLDTIKSNIAFNELQEMRAASKTGGALGSIAVRELDLLEKTLGSLDIGQGDKKLKENLLKVKESVSRWNKAQSSTGSQISEQDVQDFMREKGVDRATAEQSLKDALNKGLYKPVFNQPRAKGLNSPIQRVAEAIGQFESGGNYRAIGKDVGKGNRAYGKYQVMASNIPSWTKEALGKSLTPQQFLNNPEVQDKVALYKMAQYSKKYDTVEDIAALWFSGRPLSKAGQSRDILGTSVPIYVRNVISIYNKLG